MFPALRCFLSSQDTVPTSRSTIRLFLPGNKVVLRCLGFASCQLLLSENKQQVHAGKGGNDTRSPWRVVWIIGVSCQINERAEIKHKWKLCHSSIFNHSWKTIFNCIRKLFEHLDWTFMMMKFLLYKWRHDKTGCSKQKWKHGTLDTKTNGILTKISSWCSRICPQKVPFTLLKSNFISKDV